MSRIATCIMNENSSATAYEQNEWQFVADLDVEMASVLGLAGNNHSGPILIVDGKNGQQILYMNSYTENKWKCVPKVAPIPVKGFCGEGHKGIIIFGGEDSNKIWRIENWNEDWIPMPDAPWNIEGITGNNTDGIVIYGGEQSKEVRAIGNYNNYHWIRSERPCPFPIRGMAGSPNGGVVAFGGDNNRRVAHLDKWENDWVEFDRPCPVSIHFIAGDNRNGPVILGGISGRELYHLDSNEEQQWRQQRDVPPMEKVIGLSGDNRRGPIALCYSRIFTSSWMEQLVVKIGDIPLHKLLLPGTHDSATYGDYDQVSWAQTQRLTINQQLERGIRYFDFRVAVHGEDFCAHHGGIVTENLYSTIFDEFTSFLEKHDKELVILKFSDFAHYVSLISGNTPFEPQDHEKFKTMIASRLGKMLVPPPVPNTLNKSPGVTLNKALPKQIIAIYDAPDLTGTHLWPNSWIDDPYDEDLIIDSMHVPEDKLNTLTHFLKNNLSLRNKNSFFVSQGIFNYSPCIISSFHITHPIDSKSFISIMEYGAQNSNSWLVSQFVKWTNCELNPNILITDFVEKSNMIEIIIDLLHD